MLTVATTVKLLAEIALLALLGQWMVGVLAGANRASNPVYRVLQLVGRPWLRTARWLSPRVVADRHLPWVAGFLLLLAWVLAAFVKVAICLQIGLMLCR